MPGERPPVIDQNLAKALAHPLRARVLNIIAEGTTGPKRISEQLGVHVSNVAYHVKMLRELGCIELVETRQRRGAIEHLYRITDRALGKET